MNSHAQHNVPTRGVVLWIVGALALVVVLLFTVLLTRPVERYKLPSRLDDVLDELAALHQGTSSCVRWHEDGVMDFAQIDAFIHDLETVVVAEPRTVLPLLSYIRVTNLERSDAHHALSSPEEFKKIALGRLGVLDRMRMDMRSEQLEELIPGLQRFEAMKKRAHRDRNRGRYLFERLEPAEREAVKAVAERWRVALAGGKAQASLVHRVSMRVTQARIDVLARGAQGYHAREGRYPRDIPTILEFIKESGALPLEIERGLEQNGALYDGWLRAFEYYAIGRDGYRLTSRGGSEASHTDDIVLQAFGGKAPELIQRE